jgi:hypothetical protein
LAPEFSHQFITPVRPYSCFPSQMSTGTKRTMEDTGNEDGKKIKESPKRTFGNIFSFAKQRLQDNDEDVNRYVFDDCVLLKDFDGYKEGREISCIMVQFRILGWGTDEEGLIIDKSPRHDETNFPGGDIVQ